MTFGAVAVGVGSAVAGSAVSSLLAPSGSGTSSGAGAQAADPFASQRPQYQTMLSAMMTGKNADGTPYSFSSSDPSYQFRFDQGNAAVQSQAAAGGLLTSGNRLTATENYGQQEASTEYANQFSRLSQLSGANTGSPAAAGQIIAGQQSQQTQAAGAVGSAVATGASQIGNYFMNGVNGGTGQVSGGNSYGFQSGVSDPSYGVSSSGGAGSYSAFGYGG